MNATERAPGPHGLPSRETSHGRIAAIDSFDQDPPTMISRFMVAALCVLNDGGAIAGFYQYSAGAGPPVGFIRVP